MNKMLMRVIRVLPRATLEDLARGCGNEKPWHSDRKQLECLLISMDSKELRTEISEIVQRALLS